MAELDGILSDKYPAKAHAHKVVDHLRSKHPNANGVIYLEGQKTRMLEDSDQAEPFRQRRHFYYLSGCALPDSYLTHDIESSQTTLFIPPIDPADVIWSGLPLSPEEALARYDVDSVRSSSELNDALAKLARDQHRRTVWAIGAQVSDHVTATLAEFDEQNMLALKDAIDECRVVKDEYEVALIKKANEVSATAHTAVLRAVGEATNERELEAVFIRECMAGGCREQAYHAIVASGENGATLHYQKNDEALARRWNVLLDAGGEYRCYASDITRTFPINGTFNAESRGVYEIVMRMQRECIDMLRDGVRWEDVHVHAHRVAIDGLLRLGILKGSPQEIFDARTSIAFFPHGLGHYLGLDTHDTGGHPDYKDPDPMFSYLRVRGTLPAGSVITVEPGIYFCRFILEPFLVDPKHQHFIDQEVLQRYWSVGGVRIEDNVLVTKDGYENLTTVVKDIDEMEKIIRGVR